MWFNTLTTSTGSSKPKLHYQKGRIQKNTKYKGTLSLTPNLQLEVTNKSTG